MFKLVKISFLGDISFNNQYITAYSEGLNPFSKVGAALSSSDFVIGNLECLAKGEKGENIYKKPRLSTSVEALNYLKSIGLDIVTLAHNHVYDNLEDGFIKTTLFLKTAEINWFGAELNSNMEKVSKPLFITKDEINVCLLNYVTTDTNPNIPSDARVSVNTFDEKKVLSEINQYKQAADHVVLLLHWGGNVEGGFFPDKDQPNLARKLIDAGADLIIGHHSHTIQPFEIYKDRYVFYSLGNFCFDDVVSDGIVYPLSKSKKSGLIVNVTFKKNHRLISTAIVKNELNEMSIMEGDKSKLQIRNILFNYIIRYNIPWHFYYQMYKYIRPFWEHFSRKDITLFVKIVRFKRFIFRKIKETE